MTNRIVLPLLLTLYLAGNMLSAQSASLPVNKEDAKAELKYYRLDMVVKEVEDGRTVNSRTYSTNASTDNSSSVRTGSKVPTTTTGSYIDIGVNIDYSKIRDLGDSVALGVIADVSSVPNSDASTLTEHGAPLIRQNRWSSTVVVPLRKPTTIFSSDDVTSKRKMQVELTATPLKP